MRARRILSSLFGVIGVLLGMHAKGVASAEIGFCRDLGGSCINSGDGCNVFYTTACDMVCVDATVVHCHS